MLAGAREEERPQRAGAGAGDYPGQEGAGTISGSASGGATGSWRRLHFTTCWRASSGERRSALRTHSCFSAHLRCQAAHRSRLPAGPRPEAAARWSAAESIAVAKQQRPPSSLPVPLAAQKIVRCPKLVLPIWGQAGPRRADPKAVLGNFIRTPSKTGFGPSHYRYWANYRPEPVLDHYRFGE